MPSDMGRRNSDALKLDAGSSPHWSLAVAAIVVVITMIAVLIIVVVIYDRM